MAGSANSAAQYTQYRYYHMVMGTNYFYIIWLPLRKQQYALVLQWLGCGQGQGHNPQTQGQGQGHKPKDQGQDHNPQGQGQGRHFVASGQGQGLTSLPYSCVYDVAGGKV